jgi:hypothetical protein
VERHAIGDVAPGQVTRSAASIDARSLSMPST